MSSKLASTPQGDLVSKSKDAGNVTHWESAHLTHKAIGSNPYYYKNNSFPKEWKKDTELP